MKHFYKIVDNYTIKHDKKIKKVTNPLKINFNIFCYTYFKIGGNGEFVSISNNPE